MSQGMNRSTFRNMWLLSTLLLLALSFLVFQKGRTEQDEIANQVFQLNSLQSELENAARRALALDELDKLTINEKTATRLDILRHLSLEQSGYDFVVNARQTKQVGDSQFYLRSVTLTANLPYANALALIDRLHATKKIIINKIELKQSATPGDNVGLQLDGTIYGLDKNDS